MSKGEESKLNKLKHFLGIGSSRGASLQVGNVRPQTREFYFTPDTIKDISPQSPANHRMKTIRDLCDVVKKRKLEEVSLIRIPMSKNPFCHQMAHLKALCILYPVLTLDLKWEDQCFSHHNLTKEILVNFTQ